MTDGATLFDGEVFSALERAAGHSRATALAMDEALSAMAMTAHPRMEAEKTAELCRLVRARVEGVARRFGAGDAKP